jgi:negative regulator of flagellin synthesis FlgM
MTDIRPIATPPVRAAATPAAEVAGSRAPAQPAAAPAAERTAPAAETGTVTRLAAAAPVDRARVEAIRKALDSGTYPLKPAMMADAMIAARYLVEADA